MKIQVSELMERSGVGFGTSGARGLGEAMTDGVCRGYTRAFLDHLRDTGRYTGGSVALAGDHRPSTPRIMRAVAAAIRDAGGEVINCGAIPTPALACYGIRQHMPSIMVTGSHIPDDRNGIKFHTADGEILKADEAGIAAREIDMLEAVDMADGLPDVDSAAADAYVRRYVDFFPRDMLAGWRLGLYEHSSVAREVFARILQGLGAEVVRLGYSERFIPVDTEAIRDEDIRLARKWAAECQLRAIISADGDGDRPLISTESGEWLRGDVAGILCARQLGARAVVTPVSSNTALEKSGDFDEIRRTRIGSPYVIEAMRAARAAGFAPVVGYEANGGFLIETDIEQQSRVLPALPTRDAIIVPLALLAMAGDKNVSVSGLLDSLPPRHTASDRIKEMPTEISQSRIAELKTGGKVAVSAWLGEELAPVSSIDTTDGLRLTLANAEIVHLRPSGNAPELRCYTEADSPSRAIELNRHCLARMADWRK